MIKAERNKEKGEGCKITIDGTGLDILKEYVYITCNLRDHFPEEAIFHAVTTGLMAHDAGRMENELKDSDKDFIKNILREILK